MNVFESFFVRYLFIKRRVSIVLNKMNFKNQHHPATVVEKENVVNRETPTGC